MNDAFDVMLNDIGKANEGSFKGLINSATQLLKHWREIAEVGKALATVIALIGARSMFVNSTLGKSFLQAQATGIVRYKALFLNAMQSMSSAIKSFGSIAKTGLAGLAIYAVISAISTVWSKISELKDGLRKINEETVKSLGEIGALSSSYNDLAKAAEGANGKMKDADVQRSIDERRIALQKLIDLAAKFQSTHPHRVRRRSCCWLVTLNSFNPRTHIGCDLAAGIDYENEQQFQSTHPHRVRPNGWSTERERYFVSIHAPT